MAFQYTDDDGFYGTFAQYWACVREHLKGPVQRYRTQAGGGLTMVGKKTNSMATLMVSRGQPKK